MRRILFVLMWRAAPYYGTPVWGGQQPGLPGDPDVKPLAHGLLNSATFVMEMLRLAGFETDLVHVVDDNEIWKAVRDFQATDVVIEGYFMRPKKLDDLGAMFPDVRFIIRGHSATPFLSMDGQGFPWTLGYLSKPNGIVAPNDMRHLRELRFLADRIFSFDGSDVRDRVPYLPNYYPVGEPFRHLKQPDPGFIDVGCFGAARPMKNLVGQAIAALELAKRMRRHLRFHINGDRREYGGEPSVRAVEAIFEAIPDADLIRHNWLPHPEFKELVASMDLVTQVSFSETFCIVAADAVSQMVPTVMSAEIPWSTAHARADPNDTAQIADRMELALTAAHIAHRNFEALKAYSAKSRHEWLEYFD